MGPSASALETQSQVAAFLQKLRELGWMDGRDIRIDFRWAAGDIGLMKAYAAELAGLKPDVILVMSNPAMAVVQQQTRSLPTVFVAVADPVGSGFVQSLARPGGNVTGFTNFESSMGGKWLEVLKEIAPRVARVMVLLHPETRAHMSFWGAAEAAAPSFSVKLTMAGVHDAAEIERAAAAFAREPNGGMIVLPHTVTEVHRMTIIESAARYRLPAVYPFRHFAIEGGLISYGVDLIDAFRGAATYVDRILRGAKPGELPVQAANKFELLINLKTARALGIAVPPSLLARTDEVIE